MKAVAAVLLRFCSDLECDIALLGGTRLSDRHAATYLNTRVLKWMCNQVSSRIPENLPYLPFRLTWRVNTTIIVYVITLIFSFRGQECCWGVWEKRSEEGVWACECGGGDMRVLRNCTIYRLLLFTLERSKQEILDGRSMYVECMRGLWNVYKISLRKLKMRDN